MVELNRSHPEFDLDMEVLAFISKTPASKVTITEDMGFDGQAKLNDIIDRLKKRFRLITGKIKDVAGIFVWTDDAGFPSVREHAERYMNAVYPA